MVEERPESLARVLLVQQVEDLITQFTKFNVTPLARCSPLTYCILFVGPKGAQLHHRLQSTRLGNIDGRQRLV